MTESWSTNFEAGPGSAELRYIDNNVSYKLMKQNSHPILVFDANKVEKKSENEKG